MRIMSNPAKPVEWIESHTPFPSLLSYCTRGTNNPHFENSWATDHLAKTFLLALDDTDSYIWSGPADNVRVWLDELEKRAMAQDDLRAARTIHAIAVQATEMLLSLYLRKREVFDAFAPQCKTFPILHSIHPDSGKVAKQMLADAKLGTQTNHARQVGSKAYFLSDKPANIYARAIITCIFLNQNLATPADQYRSLWRGYAKKHGVRVRMLPLPKYADDIDDVPQLLTPENVLQYWRMGKVIIVEEMPDFHLRPEWKTYLDVRRYEHGAKTGAVQNAIFKDILTALKTIAGANRRKPRPVG